MRITSIPAPTGEASAGLAVNFGRVFFASFMFVLTLLLQAGLGQPPLRLAVRPSFQSRRDRAMRPDRRWHQRARAAAPPSPRPPPQPRRPRRDRHPAD